MVEDAKTSIIATMTHDMHRETQAHILKAMYTISNKGENTADVSAMSSAVAHQKKAKNYWNYIIAAAVVALVLFFIILGCIIHKLIPKHVELTED
jgi:hypothetical protein